VSVKVTDTDKGAKALLARLLKNGALSVGVLTEQASQPHEAKESVDRIKDIFKGPGATLTIGEIAAIHEFGLGTAPRRSFLAGWVDENQAEIKNVVDKGAKALVSGKLSGPLQFLNQLGAWAVGSIQKRMAQNIPPPLAPATIARKGSSVAPATIARKGSSVALIDTGQLRSSITYRVDAVETANGGARVSKSVASGEFQ
jgi:hypothetical protein